MKKGQPESIPQEPSRWPWSSWMKGVICTNYVSSGETVKKVLARVQVVFKKSSVVSFQDWLLHRNNALVHTGASVPGLERREDDPPPSLSAGSRPSGSFSSRDRESGLLQFQDSFKTILEGSFQPAPRKRSALAFGGGWKAAESVSTSAETMSKK